MKLLGNIVGMKNKHDLLKAATNGELDKVRSLLEADPSLITHKSLHGNNALHNAAANGHVEVVKYLVEQGGANPALGDGSGHTALWRAKNNKHTQVVEFLISLTKKDDSPAPEPEPEAAPVDPAPAPAPAPEQEAPPVPAPAPAAPPKPFVPPEETCDPNPKSKEELEQQYQSRLDSLQESLKSTLEGSGTQPSDDMDKLKGFLGQDESDLPLVQFVILRQGSPKGLAEFASQSAQNENLIDAMLSDATLMKRMLLADGAVPLCDSHKIKVHQYGNAMKTYTQILQGSENIGDEHPVLERLALAVALEHAVPQKQDNPKADKEGDEFVNPLKRYMSYETAYLNGELDVMFDTLTVWELRNVVDGEEPDWTSAWGREMLKNFRPDHILCKNYDNRYVNLVRTNIRYGSQMVKFDRDDLQQYQNILMNGGICGRRAFIGRFILRAFGIPTTARPSPGHGALIHWTPNHYWVPNLGGPFGSGRTKMKYFKDLDLLFSIKARSRPEEFWMVQRAQWWGDVCGEEPVWGDHAPHEADKDRSGWYGVSLRVQKTIVDEVPDQYDPVCTATERRLTTFGEKMDALPNSPNSKNITTDDKGVITIAAAAYDNPREVKHVQTMVSFVPQPDGKRGMQIYLPSFQAQGLTIVRGGTYKSDAEACSSGRRIKSGGYGKYPNWGFRVAISGPGDDKELSFDLGGGCTMEFVYVPPGEFIMGGDPDRKDGRFDCVEVPKHEVRLTTGFYLGKYTVTEGQYHALKGGKEPKDPQMPKGDMAEDDARDYCDELVNLIGRDFRLPTEAEWEYAARGGKGDTKWFFGDDPGPLGDYAWFKDNSDGKIHPVGQKKPNPFGLYDIYGNIVERVGDKYDKHYYEKSPKEDPTGFSQGIQSAFQYILPEDIKPGDYSLVAEVVTANTKQNINVAVNSTTGGSILELPWTNGMWQKSNPLTITVKEGDKTLNFWRSDPPQYDVAIHHLELTPC